MDPSRRQILAATLSALLVAGLVLLAVVMPAEFGLDPLGSGELLGLTGLSEQENRAIIDQDNGFREDRFRFVLQPFESLEYKYRLGKDAAMLYSWQADGEVTYDFHSEPDGGPEGFAESFDKQKRRSAHGVYVAPFDGIHGWFFENRNMEAVVIDLKTSGFYSTVTLFRDGFADERSFLKPETNE